MHFRLKEIFSDYVVSGKFPESLYMPYSIFKFFWPVQVLIVGKRAEEVAGEVRRVIEQLGSNNPKPGRYSLSDIQLFFIHLLLNRKGIPSYKKNLS